MTFEAALLQKQEEVNRFINKYLPKDGSYQAPLIEAMTYSITVGGKRIRPIIMLEVYRLFNGNDSVIEPFLTAVEMIHAYSLVHDDLPAMDDDDYRRGMLTTHKKYGEALGILAGDALLNYAFEIMSEACLEYIDHSPQTLKAMAFLGRKAGLYGMIGGQVVDIESEGKKINLEQLNFIHEHKTAALIEASMVVGATLANASLEEIEKIRRAGRNIGLAFQIQDDILDVVSSTEVLGKPIKSDEKNHKSTYVELLGLEPSKERVESLSKEAIEFIKSLEREDSFLVQLVEFLIHRQK